MRTATCATRGEREYTVESGVYRLDYASAATSYCSADERLYVQQKYGDPDDAYRAGVYEEYRYDALGRRVLVRARTDSLCAVLCYSAIERTIWDGDQLLYEIRSPGGNEVSEGGLESNHASGGTQYGRVAYLHGPGIDRPLEVIRSGYESRGPFAFLPHANWRGFFDSASRPDGTLYEECDTCMNVLWPGKHYRAYYDPFAGALPDWMGSLVTMKRDLSGQLYMRNRYYNPETGQFTQEDPVGLAGGLNLYGFAAGDPVNFSDPFGLCKKDKDGNEDPECRKVISTLKRLAAGEGISEEARNALNAAIDGYEALEADVWFSLRPDRVAEGNLGGNRGEGPWGYIRIDIAVGNRVDVGLTAWHELQHRQGRSSREHRTIYREQARILRGCLRS